MDNDQLRELANKIAANPDAVDDLTSAEVSELSKYTDPLGAIHSDKRLFINMTIVNLRDKYLLKLHTTSLIGYLYRTLEEYTPDRELEKEASRHKSIMDTLTEGTPEAKAATADHESRVKLITSTAKGIITAFLNRNFEFNPDRHLLGSHSTNPADPERVPKDELLRKWCANASAAEAIESKISGRPDALYAYLRSNLLETYQCAETITEELKNIMRVLADPGADAADKQGILAKKYSSMRSLVEDMKKIAVPLASVDTLGALKVNPPVDVFHQFERYLTNHYEQLRDITRALYNDKSDLEYCVIPYSAHKTPEAAREYRIQHERDFRGEVFAVESGAVNMIGPYKENRNRIDFYNKNTEILKKMGEQIEADHKLGGDLMGKKKTRAKKKNIEEAGPDAPELAAYSKVMNAVREMGAKPNMSLDEQRKYADAKREAETIKDSYEVPDDTIQVDMFFPATDADGTTTLKKTKFYTQAEEPLHLQEGSEFADRYQPVRAEGKAMKYKTKVIVSKTGEKKEIRVPVETTPEKSRCGPDQGV